MCNQPQKAKLGIQNKFQKEERVIYPNIPEIPDHTDCGILLRPKSINKFALNHHHQISACSEYIAARTTQTVTELRPSLFFIITFSTQTSHLC